MVRCIYSFFNPHKERFSIPTKSYLPGNPLQIACILLCERSTYRPALPITFTLLQRSETLTAGKQPRPGDAQKRTSIKTQQGDKVKPFLRGKSLLFGLFCPRE